MAENKKISGLTPMGTKTLGDIAGFAGYIAAQDGEAAYNIKCTGEELMNGIFKIQSVVEDGVAQSKIEAKDDGTIEFIVGGENDYGWELSSGGHFIPNANNSYDLGKSTSRWRDIYTNDLNLSNEGGANDVDGTWGDYTIQEGESDLLFHSPNLGICLIDATQSRLKLTCYDENSQEEFTHILKKMFT